MREKYQCSIESSPVNTQSEREEHSSWQCLWDEERIGERKSSGKEKRESGRVAVVEEKLKFAKVLWVQSIASTEGVYCSHWSDHWLSPSLTDTCIRCALSILWCHSLQGITHSLSHSLSLSLSRSRSPAFTGITGARVSGGEERQLPLSEFVGRGDRRECECQMHRLQVGWR